MKAGQCLEVQGSLGQGRWEVTRQPSLSMDSSLRAVGSTCAAQPLIRTYAHAYAHTYRGWQGLVQLGATWGLLSHQHVPCCWPAEGSSKREIPCTGLSVAACARTVAGLGAMFAVLKG